MLRTTWSQLPTSPFCIAATTLRCPERLLAGVSMFIREAPTFPSFDEAKFAPAIKMPRSSRPSAVWTLSFTDAHSAVTGVTCFRPSARLEAPR